MDLKLGKKPAEKDPLDRTIKLSSILVVSKLPELPLSYNCQKIRDGEGNYLFTIKDNFIFRNAGKDALGDCVKAARAHQTLVFEGFEQKKQIVITDQEVVDEYFRETGGPDSGLVLLFSLKDWRKKGWTLGNRFYSIYAFASVDWRDHEEVQHCIHLLGGVNLGMRIYAMDIAQFQNNEVWHLIGNNGSFKGGHGVYAFAYDDEGVTVMTWGRPQKMTWDFWDERVDEAYGIVDNKNKWQPDSALNVEKLDGYLDKITGQMEDEPSGCVFPFGGYIKKAIKPLLKGLEQKA